MSNLSEQSAAVTTGPWPVRDGFVADTAIRLDRLQTLLTRLQHEAELDRREIAELREASARSERLRSFEETLRNARDLKIDDMLRCIKDVKSRLDALEGPRVEFVGLACRSMPAIDRKIGELIAIKGRLEKLERGLQLIAVLFAGFGLLLGATVLSSWL